MSYDEHLEHEIKEYMNYEEPDWHYLYRDADMTLPECDTPEQAVVNIKWHIEDMKDLMNEIMGAK